MSVVFGARALGLVVLVSSFSVACDDGAATGGSGGGEQTGGDGSGGSPSDVGGAGGTSSSGEGGGDATGGAGGGTDAHPSTHGSGGLSCTPETTLNDEQPYCFTDIGPVELKVFVPNDGNPEPMQLAIYLHGDTANGYYEDWGFEGLSAWATANHVLFVAALAPNGCSWWRPDYSCSIDEYDDGSNADELVAAIDAIGEAHDIYTDSILFVGYSGGSTFLTRHYVPMYGDSRPGVVVANCGGVEPQPFDWSPTAETRAAVPLYYTFGSEDWMTEYIYPSIEAYEGLSFPVDVREEPGYGHCDGDYDWDARTLGLWEQHRP